MTPKGHGAPYANLAIAESLLLQAKQYNGSVVPHLIGALLAGEAFEQLLGMSQTTALEALFVQHRHEVSAEVEFLGISSDIDITKRKQDIEDSVQTLLGSSLPSNTNVSENDDRKTRQDLFLSRFWGNLRQVYRDAEVFKAAEDSNKESLVRSQWLTHAFLRKKVANLTIHSQNVFFRESWYRAFIAKKAIVGTATSLYSWMKSFLLINAFMALFYWMHASPKDWVLVSLSTVLSSVTLQPTGIINHLMEQNQLEWWFVLGITIHMGLSYLLFGVLISMLYRKITRG